MRIPALALVVLAGAAIPTVALASQGSDDPAGHDRTTTVQTNTTTATTQAEKTRQPGARRAAAIRAAKARVGGSTVVIRVRRRSDAGYEVRLRNSTTRFSVRLDRRLRIVRVRQEPLRPQPAVTAPGSDDGTADQGRGDAPGTAPSGGSTDDDGTPDQGRGDAPGTAPSGGSTDDDGTADQGRGDRSGRGSGSGHDDDSDDDDDDSGHGGSGGHGSDD